LSGLAIAALVAAVLGLAIYLPPLLRRAAPGERSLLLTLALLQLPSSALAFYLLRLPLDHWLTGILGAQVAWLRPGYAPLSEELAKLWPLLLPALRRRLLPEHAAEAGMALGLGFGMGEIGLLAHLVSLDPRLAGVPWHQFGGFIGERFLVCLCHGAFTATALTGIARWRGGLVLGPLAGMGLHLLANLPIVLVPALGLSRVAAGNLLFLWLLGYWFAMAWLLARWMPGKLALGQFLYGDAVCPRCGAGYPRPLLAFNLGPVRLERCPHCRTWNKVR
jgi:hypothetical protein